MESELIYKVLDKYYKNKYKHDFMVIKKKNKIKHFKFRDGIFNFNIIIEDNKLQCQYCSIVKNKICEHIVNVLINYYEIPVKYIYFVIIGDLWNNICQNKFNNVDNIINNYLSNNECGLCLEKLIYKPIYQCKFCFQLSHKKCIYKWLNEKKNCCIYCNKSYEKI